MQSTDETPAGESGPPADPQETPSEETAAAENSSAAENSEAAAERANGSDPLFGEPGEESALETLVGIDALKEKGLEVLAFFQSRMLTLGVAIEFAVLFAALLPAAIFGPQLKKLIREQIAPRAPYGILRRAANAFATIATPIALFVVLQIAVGILRSAGNSTAFVAAAISLLTAWIVIRLVTLVIRSPFWSKVAFYVAWPIAALDAFGLLDDVVAQLEAFSFPIGEDNGVQQRFSALDFVRTLSIFGILFWLANFIKGFIQGRIEKIDELTVSFKALLNKILDVVIPIVALIAALQIVGFPFGTLAIFGGAVGLGIGLGMQRTVSNFFAGFTLIADKSIKPGDVIEVSDTFGWVTKMNARYVSIRTRDGTAHLVPNDKFIEDGVINWSHSDRVVRLHAPFGVSYATRDVEGLARKAEEIAVTVPRVLENPKPRCNLMEFGDSSVNFDLRFWINDPANGMANVRSDVFMAIWDMLHEMGIEIPFPQRDLHIKTTPSGIVSELAPAAEPAPEAKEA